MIISLTQKIFTLTQNNIDDIFKLCQNFYMETIHKKNGRLHIYVRQDKYKGELKSHNWVGRTYINGKQKVSSSGTTNLEEAIPILEKWFDDLQNQKNEVKSEIDQNLDQDIIT